MQAHVDITRLSTEHERLDELHRDVRAGLCRTPKRLPPKYFYDERGSALFDEITRLPEYYLTRAETALLEDCAELLVKRTNPDELIEIGSGYSRKTRLLIEAMHEHGGNRYVAFDVSEDAIEAAAAHLGPDYDWLEVEGVVGDFKRHLGAVPRHGAGIVAFLGSTIGNLYPDECAHFLREVRAILGPRDRFLMGVDLVKDRHTLEAAYNDAAGVSAEFNRNVLHVINNELGADFPVEDFAHRSVFEPASSRIESGLVARRGLEVHVSALDLRVSFEEGELLETEISTKFTRESVETMLAPADLVLRRWEAGSDQAFGLALVAAGS